MYLAHIGYSASHQHTFDAVTAVSQEPSRNRLRSAATTDFIILRTRTQLGETAFSVSGPDTWNSLPESLRTIDCIATFKRQLKTEYLNIFIPVNIFNLSIL